MANTIIITGNLAGDPELRFTPGGDPVANFTVCDTPRRFNKQTNEWEDAGETLFLRCAIWREEAEQAAETLRKGQRVTVTGKLKARSWQDNDGNNRTVTECDAESVAPHPKKGQQQSQGGGWPAQQQQGGWGGQPQTQQQRPAPQQAYQAGPGGPRQDADPWQQQAAPVGGQTYQDPPF